MSLARAAIVMAVAASSSAPRADVITDWNQTALRATESAAMGPPVQARVMSIVHAAIYEAVNAIDRRHAFYAVSVSAPADASVDSAAAAAAHGVLVRLLPPQQAAMDAALAAWLAQIPDGRGKTDGVQVGRDAAEKLTALRRYDGWDAKADYAFGAVAGAYQATPPMNAQPVLPQWRYVKPFVLESASQFPFAGPPPLTGAVFAKDLNEVRTLGGRTSAQRTSEQTAIAIHWAGSEIPPLNAVARSASAARRLSVADNARLFAYLNMAMADALIAVFDAKYKFDTWRPVTAIHTAANLGNGGIRGDAAWEPLLVTPPHQEYPSAHCAAAGAAEAVLQQFFGTDQASASYVYPPLGVLRRWDSFAKISKEVEDSRVWAGIHFRTSVEHGTQVGRRIGAHAVKAHLQPLGK
jgi:hypothetical protein